jgi:hypothetical protein
VNGSAIRVTEDAVRRRFAAVRAESGSPDWTQVPVRVPDAPISKFTLDLDGGSKGLLENSENLCAKPQRATAKFTGQNGKVESLRTLLSVSCGKKSAKHHRRHPSNRRRQDRRAFR